MSNINEVKEIWNTIIEKANKADYVVIVGVASGIDVQSLLEENNIFIDEYFDNNKLFVNSSVHGIKVSEPYKVEDKKTLYVISAMSAKSRNELSEQLKSLEIDIENIEYTPVYERIKDGFESMSEKEMLEEISNIYIEKHGKAPDLENPQTYTEKVNANKIYMAADKCTLLADKYLVKGYIEKEIGKEYVVPLLGVWDNAEEINYDLLPDKFVLKTNHASGRNIIVKNKNELNIEETNNKLNKWLSENYGYNGFGLQYRDIVPKIICEEYLEGLAETVYDYQFFCFHGEPKYIWCINGAHRSGCRASFYDLDWNMQPFSFGYPRDDKKAPRPSRLNEMIVISKRLSKDFDHVRVDLYEMPDGRLLFGEMTFQTWGGA